MSSPESIAFRKKKSLMKRSIYDPSDLATQLYSAGVITKSIEDEVNDSHGLTRKQRCHILLSAVERKIHVSPRSTFKKFARCLSREATYKDLADELFEERNSQDISETSSDDGYNDSGAEDDTDCESESDVEEVPGYSRPNLLEMQYISIHCGSCNECLASGSSVITIKCNLCGSCSCSEDDDKVHYHKRTNHWGYEHSFLTLSGLTSESWSIHSSGFCGKHRWFDDYKWGIINCECDNHLGWQFKSTQRGTDPNTFFGLINKGIVLKLK